MLDYIYAFTLFLLGSTDLDLWEKFISRRVLSWDLKERKSSP